MPPKDLSVSPWKSSSLGWPGEHRSQKRLAEATLLGLDRSSPVPPQVSCLQKAARPRFAQCSARHSDARYQQGLSLVDRPRARGGAPCPSRRCPCDKRPVRRVCTQRAIVVLATALDAIPSALQQTISCAVAYSQSRDSSNRPQTKAICPCCGGASRFRCCLLCAAR